VPAIALYRALLRQCRAVPLDGEHRNSLQNIVRNRFAKNKRLANPHLNKLAFLAGYEALDILDAAVAGDRRKTEHVLDLVIRSPAPLKAPPMKTNRKASSQVHIPPVCPPPEKSLLATRPRQTVPGRRRIPYLTSAHGFPFLRFKKPQPESVSRVLRNKIAQRIRSVEHRDALRDYYIPLAEHEDAWDSLVEQELGRRSKHSNSLTWAEGYVELDAILHNEFVARATKSRELAEKMWEIVEKERELAEKESAERPNARSNRTTGRSKAAIKLPSQASHPRAPDGGP
ncbi:hypothetical protein K402DRAFT_343134, partial [Aulographum hederae CBS 113979]